ncbi:hypothetical protein HBF26_04735 [Luteibacter jiangsuensis]|uniref:Glycosyltransferase RgtA/B/C/D-like domain-containing protein n=1 Tax=Luteibacter jiangsuensis TaxID=637577 RepID=A0ABX0Q0Y8_9GAMM|nr:hypothetical protein [Luteibacter jiangsuensis]NID04179.1 hypothetical protein [Luteibacter jiangsuensis]
MKDAVRAWEWALICAGFIVLVFTLHPTVDGDGAVRFQTIQAFLGDGGAFSKFSFVQPILSMPLAWLGRFAEADVVKFVAWFNFSAFSALTIFIYRELAARYKPAVGRAWWLLMLSASMFPHHLQYYYGEVLTSLLVFLAALLIDRRPVVSAVLFALGCVNTPALLPSLVGLAVVLFLFYRRMAPLAAVPIAVALVLLEMWFKHVGLGQGYFSADEHGNVTVLPYSGRPGFSYPLLFGLMAITLSFGKGLVFFMPALLLGFFGDIRRALGLDRKATFVAFIALALPVVTYAKWWAWYGGSFWGPRFFLFMSVPASLLLAVGLRSTRAEPIRIALTLLVLLLSAWVSLEGYLFGQRETDVCWADNYAQEHLCWYAPEFSALWRPFVTGSAWKIMSNVRWPYAAWQLVVIFYLAVRLAEPLVEMTRRRLNEVRASDPGSHPGQA